MTDYSTHYHKEENMFMCNHCSYSTEFLYSINRHFTKKNKCYITFDCADCKNKFSTQYKLDCHRKSCSNQDNNETDKTVNAELALQSDDGPKQYLQNLEDKEKINSLQKEVEFLKSKLQKNSTSQELEKENLLLEKKVTLLEKDVEDLTENYIDAVHKYFNVHMISKSKNFEDMSYYFFRTNIDVHYEQFSYFMDHVKSEQLYSVNYKIHHVEFKEKKEKLVQFLKQYIEELQKSQKHTLYGKNISYMIHELSTDSFELEKKFGTFQI
jgi:hypothetical protein